MNTASVAELNFFHNSLLCEQCCRTLVVPKHRWLEQLQEHLHALSEIALIMGKSFAAFLIGTQFIVEAIFPHLNRQKHPDELERERREKEWKAKRDSEINEALERRLAADAREEAAYINSLKLSYVATAKEYYDDRFYTDERNKLVDQIERESKDPEKDRITLRKYAVDVEQLRVHEMRRKQRKNAILNEVDYHVSEMKRWDDRARHANDIAERARCEREFEVHETKAHHARIAHENA